MKCSQRNYFSITSWRFSEHSYTLNLHRSSWDLDIKGGHVVARHGFLFGLSLMSHEHACCYMRLPLKGHGVGSQSPTQKITSACWGLMSTMLLWRRSPWKEAVLGVICRISWDWRLIHVLEYIIYESNYHPTGSISQHAQLLEHWCLLSKPWKCEMIQMQVFISEERDVVLMTA